MSICLCVLLFFVWVFIVGGVGGGRLFLLLFCSGFIVCFVCLSLFLGCGWVYIMGGGDITLLYLWNFVCLSARGAVHGLTGDGWCSRLSCTCSRL